MGVDASFKDHFSSAAEGYAAHRPTYPAELVRFLARLAPGRRLAWDAGCGSGQLSVLLAEGFERVIATDASAEQIAHAAPHPKVEYRQSRAEASGLNDASADVITAAQAAHWFDLPAFYAEVRRVGRPGAVVGLTVYNLVQVDEAIDRVVRRFYAEVLGAYWPAERRHVENDYASLPFPFDAVEVPRLEMRATFTLPRLIEYMRTWSAVIALERAKGRAPLEALRHELAPLWGGGGDGARPVHWPLTLRVGRV
jgi:SAM-dependent methyltransferase